MYPARTFTCDCWRKRAGDASFRLNADRRANDQRKFPKPVTAEQFCRRPELSTAVPRPPFRLGGVEPLAVRRASGRRLHKIHGKTAPAGSMQLVESFGNKSFPRIAGLVRLNIEDSAGNRIIGEPRACVAVDERHVRTAAPKPAGTPEHGLRKIEPPIVDPARGVNPFP